MAQESARKSGHHRHSRDIRPRLRLLFIAMDDPIIQCVERFCCPRGALFAERRNRGYTLYDASSGAPVARLRPTGHPNKFEILYCSLWKQRWTSTGPFGRTVLSINDALQFIAYQDIFWAMTRSVQNPKLRKVELRCGCAGRQRARWGRLNTQLLAWRIQVPERTPPDGFIH